ncbi:MAG: response regulator, partial [Treponema sp.]|nr:response regulator [Treponema sp.]
CVLNLLTNAVKYTKEGSVTFSISHTKIDDKNVSLTVKIKDTGVGIKKEDMDKLFSPFDRIEEDKTIEGTGLGMSIVVKLLAMMKSKLEVKSEYGKGSEFSFSIEQEVADWTQAGDINSSYQKNIEQMQNYKEKLHAPKARLLFVDDTEMNLEVIKGLLKKTGIKIDTATSGREALERVTGTAYDILFIDHRMPEMDGIETLHAMESMEKNLCKGKPCIALTANAISGVKKMYLEEGFTDYLSKPVNPDKLEDMIRQYLPPEYLEISENAADEEEISADAENAEEQEFMARFTAIDGINAQTALTNCGTKKILKSTVTKYYASIEEKSKELQDFFESENWKDYGIKVHALKSTSRLIGAMELSKMAENLELCAENGAIEEIKAKHKDLIEFYKSYQERLSVIVANDDNKMKKKELSKEDTEAELKKLAKCAENFDITGLDDIIKELETFSIPDEFNEMMKKIKTYVDNIDFKALRELLK